MKNIILAGSFLLIVGSGMTLSAQVSGNAFNQTDLICDPTYYAAQGFGPNSSQNPIQDSNMYDAWGLAIRPAGAGGHFWIEDAVGGFSSTYQGDVNGVPLHEDGLTGVPLDAPSFTDHGYAFVTGVAYNSASDIAGQPADFPVTSSNGVDDDTGGTPLNNGNPLTNTAKFVFCTEDGCINAWWTNTAAAMTTAQVVVNYSKTSSFPPGISANPVYTGVTITQNAYTSAAYANNGVGTTGNLVFAADQRNNVLEVFENKKEASDTVPLSVTQWTDVTSRFHLQTPAWLMDTPTHVAPLHVFNVMDIAGHLYVTYAKFNAAGDEGQEQVGGPGLGHVVEYNEDGSLVMEFNDGATAPTGVENNNGTPTPITGQLDEPWGVAIAPSAFGSFGGDVLVANFHSDTIAAFDPKTGNFIDYLRDSNGNPINVDGIWGLTFGNGQSLGDANSLYFTAGPNSEYDGLFGKLTVAAVSADSPTIPPAGLVLLALTLIFVAARCLPKRQIGITA